MNKITQAEFDKLMSAIDATDTPTDAEIKEETRRARIGISSIGKPGTKNGFVVSKETGAKITLAKTGKVQSMTKKYIAFFKLHIDASRLEMKALMQAEFNLPKASEVSGRIKHKLNHTWPEDQSKLDLHTKQVEFFNNNPLATRVEMISLMKEKFQLSWPKEFVDNMKKELGHTWPKAKKRSNKQTLQQSLLFKQHIKLTRQEMIALFAKNFNTKNPYRAVDNTRCRLNHTWPPK